MGIPKYPQWPQWSPPLEPKRCKANFTRHSTKAATRKPKPDLRERHGVERGGVTCKSIMVHQWFKVYQWFTMVYPMKIMKMEHVPINDNE